MNIRKFFSLLTALCFLVSFAGQSLSWAAPGSSVPNKIGAAEFRQIFEKIPMLPPKYGKVTHMSDMGSDTIAVNIQDLHCHPEAQKNINAIIGLLDKNYKARCVYVEGAYDKIDTGWLSEIRDKSLRNAIALQMVEDGNLNASEYYAVINDKKDFLFGLEDKARHEENIKRLGYILSRRQQYDETLSKVRKNMEYWDAKYTNIRNKRFNKTLDKYRKQQISTERFYVILSRYMKKINENPQAYNNVLPIKLSDYPNIRNYLFVAKTNSELDMKTVQIQMQALMAFLKTKLPPQAFQMFLDETENLSNIDRLAAALSNFSTMFDIKLSIHYKQLDAFFKLQKLSGEINPLEIISEERHLVERLRAALSYDRTELEISFLNDFTDYFSDYLQNKLMADDFAYFDYRFGDFRKLYSKYATENDLKDIERDFELISEYYRLNDKRNDIFAENIFKRWNLRGQNTERARYDSPDDIFKNAKEIIIIITGGYHSYGLKQIFARNGISSVIITPSVTTDIEPAADKYDNIIRRQSEFLREALAFTIASQAGNALQYRVLTEASIAFLQNAKYNRGNIAALAERLRSVIDNGDISIAEAGNETEIRFKDGKSVTLIKNEEGFIALKQDGAFYGETKPGAGLKEKIIDLAQEALSYNPPSGALSLLLPDIGRMLTSYIMFAEKNNLLLSEHGITMDVADYVSDGGKTEVYGIELGILGKLPAALQEAFLRAQQAEDRQSEKRREALRRQRKSELKSTLIKIAASVIFAVAVFASTSFSSQHGGVHTADINAPTSAQSTAFEPVAAINLSAEQILNDNTTLNFLIETQTLPDTPEAQRINSVENMESSLRESEKKESLDLVNEAYLFLQNKANLFFPEKYPVLFLQNAGGDINFSAAETEQGFIVMSAEALKGKSRQERIKAVALKIAEEAFRIKNKDDVASGKMTKLQDITEAFKAAEQALRAAYPQDTEAIMRRHNVANAFRHIIDNREAVMRHVNSKEPAISFSNLYYSGIENASEYNKTHARQIPDDVVVIRLFNEEYGNAANAPYEYSFFIDVKTDRIINIRTESKISESRLELSDTKRQADTLGLKGFRRAFFAARKEFIPSLQRGFAQRHLSVTEKSANLRKAGDIIIKSATVAGAVFGCALTVAMAASLLSFVSVPALIAGGSISAGILSGAGGYSFNITAHTVYNLLAPRGSELEINIKKNTRKFFHGGLPENFDFEELDLLRFSAEQQNQGIEHAGFYLVDEANKQEAYGYANLISDGSGGVVEFEINEDARIYKLDSSGAIERVSRDRLKELYEQGYDMISGPNYLGKTEYLLLNKAAVQSHRFERFIDEDTLFQAISDSTNTDYLINIIGSKNIPAILKFHAFNRLGQLNYNLSGIGETLAKEAEPLLRDYLENAREILEEHPHRDAKLGAMGAAEIILLKSKHPQLIKFDYNQIAKETSEFRWARKTFAARDKAGIEFGKDFIYGEKAFTIFLQLAAHEFAHKIQFEFVKDFESDKINDSISEIFADSFSFLLSAELGLDTEPFKQNLKYRQEYDSVTDPSKAGWELERTFDDPYEGARSFLFLLLENNDGDLSVSQAVKLAESVFNVIQESAGIYAKMDQQKRNNFVGKFQHYFGGAAAYFRKILSMWSGEKVELPAFRYRDREYGQLPPDDIFKKAVEHNLANRDAKLTLFSPGTDAAASSAEALKTDIAKISDAAQTTDGTSVDLNDFFAGSLSAGQEKVRNMLSEAKKTLGRRGKAEAKELDKALSEVSAYIKERFDGIIKHKRDIDINSADDILLLAALEIFFDYFSNPETPSGDFSKTIFADAHAFDYVWEKLFYVVPGKHRQDMLLQNFISLKLLKPLSDLSGEYKDDFSAVTFGIFSDKVKFINKYYPGIDDEVPAGMLRHLEDFFYGTYDYAPGLGAKMNAFKELIKSENINNRRLLAALNKLVTDAEEKRKTGISAVLEAALDIRLATEDNVSGISTPQAREYQFMAAQTENDIADSLRIMREMNIELTASQKKKLDLIFPQERKKYLEILIHRGDEIYLTELVNGESDLAVRLFALMYLAMLGKETADASGIIEEYASKMSSVEINNDYELRAFLFGTHFLLASNFSFIKDLRDANLSTGGNLLAKISSAVMVSRAQSSSFTASPVANFDFIFSKNIKDTSLYAHELAHNYLIAIAPKLTPFGPAKNTFHEFFAYIFQSFAGSAVEEANTFIKRHIAFKMFSAEGKPQQEHEAAKGFLNVLKNTMNILKLEFSWESLIKAAAEFAKHASESDFAGQSAAMESFITFYADLISKQYPGTESGEFIKTFKSYADIKDGRLLSRKILADNVPLTDNAGNYAYELTELDYEIAENYADYTRNELKKAYSDKEIGYLEKVMRFQHDENKLREIVNDDSADMGHRLTALSILGVSNIMLFPQELASEFADKMAAEKITVENNFDLRAVLTGINLLMMLGLGGKFSSESGKSVLRGIYLSVRAATLLKQGDHKAPSNGMHLTSFSLDEMKAALMDEYSAFYFEDFEEELINNLKNYSPHTALQETGFPRLSSEKSIDINSADAGVISGEPEISAEPLPAEKTNKKTKKLSANKKTGNFLSSLFASKSGAGQIIVNYHLINRGDLLNAVNEFGSAATLTDEGYINLPVYVVNERPRNYRELDFKNTGVSINGNTLWASASKGAVIIYGEGAAGEAISQELASNRKINELVKQNAKSAAKTSMKNVSVEWIEVDHANSGKAITYSENGNVQAGYEIFKQMLERGEMQEFSASLRKIKNVDGFTLAQGILHNLDDITETADFMDYLAQHRKIGNGQIIIDTALAEKIIEKTGKQNFAAFLDAARKDGVQVFLLSGSEKMPVNFEGAGFSGHLYINPETQKAELHNYALGTASQVSLIENITSPEALEDDIKRAGETVLINNSQLKNIINAQKSGIAISRIIEILSSFKILKMFTPQKMTDDFALKAARNFEIADMPEVGPESINAIMQLYAESDFKGIINLLNLPASHPVSVYIMKIESQTADIKVYNAFVGGITEKILAAESLRKVHKPYGLQDNTYEIILGRALVLQALEKSSGKGVSIDHNTLGATMKEAEEKLRESLQKLMPEAFENKDPKAINAIAELIPEVAEERRKKLTKDEIKPDMDMKNYENILFAA